MKKKTVKIKPETYRDVPREEVENYADFHELNIETEENFREAAQAYFAIQYAPKIPWVFDKVNARVVDENDKHIFYTHDLQCDDSIVEEVVKRFNRIKQRHVLGSTGYIDKYLLYADCTSDDLEIIVGQIARNYYNYL